MSLIPFRRPLRCFLILCATVLTAVFPRAAQAQEGKRPNIIFVLLDNLGWGELGCYGGGALRGAPTPQLDAFAAQGLRLTNFNVEASCTPTRSALMTGRFSVRSGNLRSNATGLVRWEVTLPQLLKKQGYTTAHYGKWHLGDEQGRYPNDFGFDEWYGIPRTSNEAMNWDSPGYDPAFQEPMYIMAGTAGARSSNVKVYDMQAREDIDAELIDKTIGFAQRNAAAKTPFFAYVPMTQVHFPFKPSKAFAGKSGYGDLADSVMQTDYLVGRLLTAIDKMGLAENTLVIVASDNGPDYRRPWRGSVGPWSGTMHTMLEGGLRAPALVRWPGHIKPGVSDGMVHAVDLFNTLVGVGGAKVPGDRPIDGQDMLPFFTGAVDKSPRFGFPLYMEGELFGVKFRDWKYHILWKPDPEKPMQKPARPMVFNVTVDPKEELPRSFFGENTHMEDWWIVAPIRKIMADFQASTEAFPSVPFGAKRDYVPKPAPAKAKAKDMADAD